MPRTVTAQVWTGSSPVNNTYPEARQQEWRSPPHRQTPAGTPSKAGERYDTPFHTPDDSPTSAEKHSSPMSSSEPLPEDGVEVRDFAQFSPTPRARAPKQPMTNGVPYRIARVVQSDQAPLRSDESTARVSLANEMMHLKMLTIHRQLIRRQTGYKVPCVKGYEVPRQTGCEITRQIG